MSIGKTRVGHLASCIASIAFLASGCASKVPGAVEGKVYQATASREPIPSEDAEMMKNAGLVPANYVLSLGKMDGFDTRSYVHPWPWESDKDLDAIAAKADSSTDAILSRLPDFGLVDLVSELGSPTNIFVSINKYGRQVYAEYAGIGYYFADKPDELEEIRYTNPNWGGTPGRHHPDSAYRFKGLGIGSSSDDVFAVLGEPVQAINTKDLNGGHDRVLENVGTEGISYIAYLREGVRFFFSNNTVISMYLFKPNPYWEDKRPISDSANPASQGPAPTDIQPYNDIRDRDLSSIEEPLKPDLMRTLWFSSSTKFDPASASLASKLIEEGKNPGLGVRALHEDGITGAGVLVGIIDQNLPGADHPEYAGKVEKYRDFGTGQGADRGSMHGPAVLSLLVGAKAGTAPGARAYFAAVPSWTGDAKYYADALDWMVDESAKLPNGRGIKVVSVSAAPSGPGTPFGKNGDAWDAAVKRAAASGLLVLDCSSDKGRIDSCYLRGSDRENPKDYTGGYPGMPYSGITPRDPLRAPTSFRSTAEAYQAGSRAWQYTGRGGLSWAIPWTSGVLALGWQLDPSLDAGRIMELLEDSAYRNLDGERIIDPKAFVDGVKKGSR